VPGGSLGVQLDHHSILIATSSCDVQDSQGVSASEMTYIVSVGSL